MTPADQELWRRSQPTHGSVEVLYTELLAGSARPDLIAELIAGDNQLAAIISVDEPSPVPMDLRNKIIARWDTDHSKLRQADGTEVVPFARWSQWSSLAASLLVASAAGLYLGQSVGQADRADLPEASLWAIDIDGLSLDGMIPGHQGDS